MKIIYMGTPDFAVEALEALASSRHEVTAVFTQPDKPRDAEKRCSLRRSKKWHSGRIFRSISRKR